MTVTIAENQQVSQPNPLSGGQTAVTNNSTINVQQEQGRMFKLDTGATLDDLVRAVNQVGVAPGDLMAILEALQQLAPSKASWSYCNQQAARGCHGRQ